MPPKEGQYMAIVLEWRRNKQEKAIELIKKRDENYNCYTWLFESFGNMEFFKFEFGAITIFTCRHSVEYRNTMNYSTPDTILYAFIKN